MDILNFHKKLIDNYKIYIQSFLNIKDPSILKFVDNEIGNKKLWPEPLVQFNPTFEKGIPLSTLVKKGYLHNEIDNIFAGFSLYRHQEEAILLGAKGEEFIVTSGTGSGKSLTYMATIFNYVLSQGDFASKILVTCFCINFSSLILDYIAKQKVGGINLNFFYVQQLPFLNPENYSSHTQREIILNAIELIYSSWDIKAFADDIWKEADSGLKVAITKQWEENKVVTGGHEWAPPEWCEIDKAGCILPPFKWDESRRAVLKAKLDAIYAKLYGLTTEELKYILDPQDVYGPDFPGETFRVLKEKEIRLYGEYRTRRLVLEAWRKLNSEES